MKIIIAEDFALVRDGLNVVMQRHFSPLTLGEAETAEDLLDLLSKQSWDLLLIDSQILQTGRPDLLSYIREQYPQLPILMMSFELLHLHAVPAIKAGIKGYLTKSDIVDKLPQAINKILAGGRYISPDIAEDLAAVVNRDDSTRELSELLSERELAIMSMLSQGKTPKHIAYDLGLSIKTISTYRGRALKKMNMRSNAEFFRYVIKNNLMP